MQEESVRRESVAWTTRDVWLGVGVFGAWLLASVGLALLIQARSWDVDLGLFVTLGEMPLLVPVWWFTIKKYGLDWRAVGIRRFSGQTIGVGCGLMILSFGFNLVYNLFLSSLGLQAQADWVAVFEGLSSPWPLLVGGIVVAPFVEELFFRGFVFAGLRERYGWQKAGLISAGLFALVHLQPLAIPPIFVLGMIFAYLYHRSESIWPATVMHVLTNGIGLGLAYLVSQSNGPVG